MAARKVFVNKETGEKEYKINIPMYFDVDMISKLSELSGKSEKYIIDELIWQCQYDLLYGLGEDRDAYDYIYIDEDDNSVVIMSRDLDSDYEAQFSDDDDDDDKPDEYGVSYNLVKNIKI